MEKKVFSSRINVLLIMSMLVILLIKLLITIFDYDIQGACILGGVLLFIILILGGMRYVISGKKLYIKMCWVIPFGSVNITDIISIKRSYNPLASPAASLKRLCIYSRRGVKLISPVREQEFCDTLVKINPDISIHVNDKKSWYRIWDWDIPIETTTRKLPELDWYSNNKDTD